MSRKRSGSLAATTLDKKTLKFSNGDAWRNITQKSPVTDEQKESRQMLKKIYREMAWKRPSQNLKD